MCERTRSVDAQCRVLGGKDSKCGQCDDDIRAMLRRRVSGVPNRPVCMLRCDGLQLNDRHCIEVRP